jgi:hypothetical protein
MQCLADPNEEGTMELQYELTFEDRMAAQAHVMSKLVAAQRTVAVRLLYIAIVVVFWIGLMLALPRGTSVFATAMLYAAMLFVAASLLRIAGAVRKAAIHRSLKAEFYENGQPEHATLSIEPDGLVTQTAYSAERTLWPGVKRVENAEAHILIVLRYGVVLTIPKRAFRDEQHMCQFLDEMDRLRAAAQAQSQV